MKCPYCNEFKGNSKVRGYSVREQLHTHILNRHSLLEVKEVTQVELDKMHEFLGKY